MAKILLIEKAELSCRILQQQLQGKGYDVITATEGGDQGIVLAITTSPDLILVGTELPTINGWQTTEILKESTVTQKIPVIVLATPTTHKDWAMLSHSSCNDYILKPVNIKSLLGKIETLLKELPVTTDVDPDAQDRSVYQQNQALKEVELSIHTSAPAYRPRQKQALGRPMIIYIENNPAYSQAMVKISQDAGYRYASFADSFEALPVLLNFKPQLILLSATMPVVSGYELCSRIRRVSSIRNTPVVIMSKNDGALARMRSKVAGASDLLKKPIEKKSALKVLQHYLQPIEITQHKNRYQYGF